MSAGCAGLVAGPSARRPGAVQWATRGRKYKVGSPRARCAPAGGATAGPPGPRGGDTDPRGPHPRQHKFRARRAAPRRAVPGRRPRSLHASVRVRRARAHARPHMRGRRGMHHRDVRAHVRAGALHRTVCIRPPRLWVQACRSCRHTRPCAQCRGRRVCVSGAGGLAARPGWCPPLHARAMRISPRCAPAPGGQGDARDAQGLPEACVLTFHCRHCPSGGEARQRPP